MNAILTAVFGNWQMTLLGAIGAAGAYVATQPGSGWQILGTIIPLVIGAIAHNPTTKEAK